MQPPIAATEAATEELMLLLVGDGESVRLQAGVEERRFQQGSGRERERVRERERERDIARRRRRERETVHVGNGPSAPNVQGD